MALLVEQIASRLTLFASVWTRNEIT